MYIYKTCLFRHFWQSIKQYIKFNAKNTLIKTRIHNPDKNKNRNTNIYINIKTK